METDMFNKLFSTVAAIAVAGAIATSLTVSSQAAETLDMSAFSCNQYLSSPEDAQLAVLYWLDGYLSHRQSNLMIDSDDLIANHQFLTEFCQADPRQPIVEFIVSSIDG
jgi:HdeA/HdeB family